MAPENRTHAAIDSELRAVVESLYNIIIQVYDHKGAPTEVALKDQISKLVASINQLLRLSKTSTVQIPPDVVQYIEQGRNPDIYMREFIELSMLHNQRLRGKMAAFGTFRDILAREMTGAIPALREDVERVVEHTGGTVKTGS
ncbi:mediator of RNA polymerase II transcription subunit 10 [Microthyrium microscopicum]|uniref:Mediator of RNA polymerase II transcription subunit 10 n=1 Tax=Microthyrium microscopicum TaxID=703497 RepID=A0A6A6UCL1_9PEZI|nr:mediator of RNA polymerase II transcription subunit 10 [Microthyrium microscopicum]